MKTKKSANGQFFKNASNIDYEKVYVEANLGNKNALPYNVY